MHAPGNCAWCYIIYFELMIDDAVALLILRIVMVIFTLSNSSANAVIFSNYDV